MDTLPQDPIGRLWAHGRLTVLEAPGFSSLQLRKDRQGGLTLDSLHFSVPPGPPSGPPRILGDFLGVRMSPQGFLMCAEVWVHYLKVMSNSFVTPWIITRQTPLSMEFCRQEYWSG